MTDFGLEFGALEWIVPEIWITIYYFPNRIKVKTFIGCRTGYLVLGEGICCLPVSAASFKVVVVVEIEYCGTVLAAAYDGISVMHLAKVDVAVDGVVVVGVSKNATGVLLMV